MDGVSSMLTEIREVMNEFHKVTKGVDNVELKTLILSKILSNKTLLPKACLYLHKSLILNTNDKG